MLTCDDYLTPGSLDEAFDIMASKLRTLSHRRGRDRHFTLGARRNQNRLMKSKAPASTAARVYYA